VSASTGTMEQDMSDNPCTTERDVSDNAVSVGKEVFVSAGMLNDASTPI